MVVILIKPFCSIVVVLVVSVCMLRFAKPAISKSISDPPSVFTVLNWFPEDIETLVVFRDFRVPQMLEEIDQEEALKRDFNHLIALPLAGAERAINRYREEANKPKETEEQLYELAFYHTAVLPLSCSEVDSLYKLLSGQKVILSVEASKNFRYIGREGTNAYDGCHILWFKEPIPKSFLFELQKAGNVFEHRGHNVRSIPVDWSSDDQKGAIYITLSGDNVLLVATDKMFLQTVLDRMDSEGPPARRGLPDSLPEWKYVDANKRYWAVRHMSQSSKVEMSKEELPVLDGVVAQLDHSDVRWVSVSILCGDRQDVKKVLRRYWGDDVDRYPRVKKEDDHFWTFCLKSKSGDDVIGFNFVLDALLGHAIYF